MGFSWLAIGTAMYYYYRKKKKIAIAGQLKVESIEIPEYQKMRLTHILVVTRSVGGIDALQMAFQLARDHHAKVTAVSVMEIPYSMPIDAHLEEREKRGEEALKRAEAIGREYNVSVHLECIRSRSTENALLTLAQEGQYDLIVISANQKELQDKENFAVQAEEFLKNAPCRVIFCKS